MKIGEEVVLKEALLLVGACGSELLPKGSCGVIQHKNGTMVSLLCGDTIYSDVPLFAIEPVRK